MNEPSHATLTGASVTPEQTTSMLFYGLVMQLAQAALSFLGSTDDEEAKSGGPDLDSARLCIDQIDMLATKTRGNLSAEESRMLHSTLSTLRMAFVKAVDRAEASPSTAASSSVDSRPGPGANSVAAPDAEPPAEESKRFVKKY